LWDLSVRELSIPNDNALYDEYEPRRGLRRLRELNQEYGSKRSLKNSKPSFTREIFPILYNAFSMKWVHGPLTGPGVPRPHSRISDFAILAELPGSSDLRASILHRLRDPESSEFRPIAMPQSFGDNYDLLDRQVASGFLSLTRTQYWLVEQWAKGNFEADWQGIPSRPTLNDISPEGLDRAALENCVGGGFYPGIEVSWLIRKRELFSEPFRIRHGVSLGSLKVEAGFFSQQMALPWQADFYQCAKEGPDQNGIYHAWWPGQRPDDVFLDSNLQGKAEWARGVPDRDGNIGDVNFWRNRGFVVENNGKFIEVEGPPPQ
jgi:hypothetical protein